MSATGALEMNHGRRARPAWLSWTRSPWIVPLPGFILLALLSLPPFVYAVYLSFVNIDGSLPNNPVKFVWFQNYIAVLGSQNGFHALLITLIVSFGSTLAAISVGLLIAYLIHLYAGRLDGLVTILVLIPLAVSPVAMALVFSLMLDPLYGPVPQVIALGALVTVVFVQTWQWSPLAVILLLGGIKSLPVEPVEAARIDGASAWQTLWHIHLPLLRPLLAVAAIFEFILCSQVFAATELLTNGGPGNATVDLSLYIYKIGISESSQVSVAAAAGVITLLLGLLSTTVWLRIAKWDEKVYR
jgi:multiple sugar transport system permease protein